MHIPAGVPVLVSIVSTELFPIDMLDSFLSSLFLHDTLLGGVVPVASPSPNEYPNGGDVDDILDGPPESVLNMALR
jgi:hypothetical protein